MIAKVYADTIFTTKEMMDWLNDKNLSQEKFKEEYYKFLNLRYMKIKELIKKNVFKI